jgi:phosphatidylglycerol phospholipase C
LFIKECKAAGKDIMVWTVNARNEWIQATKWGVSAILTDKTGEFLNLRKEIEGECGRAMQLLYSF